METKIGKLVLVRHGESEWTKLGKWTGITDVNLSEDGFKKSKEIGSLISDLNFDHIFISKLVRTRETLDSLTCTDPKLKTVKTEEAEELNERDYGEYTGKNKWEMKKILGEEKFLKVRRSWDNVPLNGESLKMVYERTIPFYLSKILPILRENKNVLIVAHGNSNRSIVKYIENISDEKIPSVEIAFEEVLIYDLDNDGHMIDKEVRKIN